MESAGVRTGLSRELSIWSERLRPFGRWRRASERAHLPWRRSTDGMGSLHSWFRQVMLD